MGENSPGRGSPRGHTGREVGRTERQPASPVASRPWHRRAPRLATRLPLAAGGGPPALTAGSTSAPGRRPPVLPEERGAVACAHRAAGFGFRVRFSRPWTREAGTGDGDAGGRLSSAPRRPVTAWFLSFAETRVREQARGRPPRGEGQKLSRRRPEQGPGDRPRGREVAGRWRDGELGVRARRAGPPGARGWPRRAQAGWGAGQAAGVAPSGPRPSSPSSAGVTSPEPRAVCGPGPHGAPRVPVAHAPLRIERRARGRGRSCRGDGVGVAAGRVAVIGVTGSGWQLSG